MRFNAVNILIFIFIVVMSLLATAQQQLTYLYILLPVFIGLLIIAGLVRGLGLIIALIAGAIIFIFLLAFKFYLLVPPILAGVGIAVLSGIIASMFALKETLIKPRRVAAIRRGTVFEIVLPVFCVFLPFLLLLTVENAVLFYMVLGVAALVVALYEPQAEFRSPTDPVLTGLGVGVLEFAICLIIGALIAGYTGSSIRYFMRKAMLSIIVPSTRQIGILAFTTIMFILFMVALVEELAFKYAYIAVAVNHVNLRDLLFWSTLFFVLFHAPTRCTDWIGVAALGVIALTTLIELYFYVTKSFSILMPWIAHATYDILINAYLFTAEYHMLFETVLAIVGIIIVVRMLTSKRIRKIPFPEE